VQGEALGLIGLDQNQLWKQTFQGLMLTRLKRNHPEMMVVGTPLAIMDHVAAVFSAASQKLRARVRGLSRNA